VKRSFDRTYSELSELFRFLDECLDAQHVKESAAFAARLALEEVFTNMVKYSISPVDTVSVAIDTGDGDLILRLADHDAEPFDPTSHPEPDLRAPLAQRKPGGLGLHLIRHLADSFEHEYVDGSNVVTIRIRMTGTHESPATNHQQ